MVSATADVVGVCEGIFSAHSPLVLFMGNGTSWVEFFQSFLSFISNVYSPVNKAFCFNGQGKSNRFKVTDSCDLVQECHVQSIMLDPY